jgi:WhiB family transcriptional regulator, redox-sensing transcriptional regulator
MNWRDKAACIDENVELFFPTGSSGPALDQINRAKAICCRCKVSTQCLEWALKTHQDAGIWGGKTEDERRALRRARQRRSGPGKPTTKPTP